MATSENPYLQDPGRRDESYGAGHGRGGADGGPGRSAGGDERSLAIVAHLSALAAMVLSASFLIFVGPLIVWLMFRDRGRLVRAASAGAFNFAVGITLLGIAAWICFFTIVLIPLAIVLWVVVVVSQVWCSLRGAFAASRGQIYRYPFQVPILS